MKIAIVSAWNKGYQSLADITVPNHKQYCEKHGYESVTVNDWEGGWDGRGPQWGRFDVARKVLHRFDTLFIMDIDAVITNMDIKIEDLATSNLVATYDVNGFNCGMLIIKNTSWTVQFMDRYWEIGGRYQHHVNPEQTCLAHLLIMEPKENWEIKPQRSMNSFPYTEKEYAELNFPEGNWQPGDFVLHTPAISLERRVEIFGKQLHGTSGKLPCDNVTTD